MENERTEKEKKASRSKDTIGINSTRIKVPAMDDPDDDYITGPYGTGTDLDDSQIERQEYAAQSAHVRMV